MRLTLTFALVLFGRLAVADPFTNCTERLGAIYRGWTSAQLEEACFDAHPDCVVTLAKRHHGEGSWDGPWHYRTSCRGDLVNCAGRLATGRTRFEWPEALRDLCLVCGFARARALEIRYPRFAVSEILNQCRLSEPELE